MKLFCMKQNEYYNLIFCFSLLLLLLFIYLFVSFRAQDKVINNAHFHRISYTHPRHIGQTVFSLRILRRRVSSGVVCGSMTVESAMVVPLFIFCVLDLMFGIQVVETQSRINAALHETGSEICSYGYAIERGLGDAPAGIVSEAYAIGSVAHHLGSGVDKRGGILGGRVGLVYGGTEVMKDGGIVNLKIRYLLRFPVDLHLRPFMLGTSFYGHAWVGYDGSGSLPDSSDDDPIVYITPTGTVYHRSYDCRHLHPSVKSISSAAVDGMRNSDGSKYYPCEVCGGGSGIGTVFITNSGNRYHSDLMCPGIKRNIIAIHLSEVGGRAPCSLCGY